MMTIEGMGTGIGWETRIPLGYRTLTDTICNNPWRLVVVFRGRSRVN
jgi:hypothetical protein